MFEFLSRTKFSEYSFLKKYQKHKKKISSFMLELHRIESAPNNPDQHRRPQSILRSVVAGPEVSADGLGLSVPVPTDRKSIN